MAIGADLRDARVARNRSIEGLSRATKISVRVLRALEEEKFGKIPGGLFTRGYLRAYAREVGLDPDEVVRKYRAEFEPEPPPAEPDQARVAPSVRSLLLSDADTVARVRPLIELGVIALIAGICFAYVVATSRPATPADATTTPAPSVETPKEHSVATTGSADAAPSAVKIEMRATGPCWVEAVAGEKRLVARLMNEGDTETVTVQNDVSLRVGDPSTLSYTIDGKMGRLLGPPGKPVRVEINPQNHRQFLVAR